MSRTRAVYPDRSLKLDPGDYAVAWIAPLEIEAQAALHSLDERHRGRFLVGRGDDYVFHAGSIYGHNIVIATLPAGQEYGTGSAAALASQLKKFFPNLWFGLLVGVAAGLPDLSQNPARDIRLGDVLVALPNGDNAELIAYDLGKETEDGFQPLRIGHALGASEPIVRAAIGSIKLEAPNDADIFLPYYEAIRDKEHATGTFADPGQDRDILYVAQDSEFEKVVERIPRPESKRTRVWYGPIGSGDKLLKNAQKRNELRDTYGLIGLEMEAAGTMNRIPVSVIRGVCDYGDKHKNKIWQPYAAAMAASYAKAVLHEIPPRNPSGHDAPEVGYGPISRPTISGKTEEQNIELVNTSGLTSTTRQPCYHIQLTRNSRFTGRTAILNTLEAKFFGKEPSRKLSLVGLGGVGKTQIALYYAYLIKEKRPDYSIFWVPVLSNESVEQAYVEIAKKLGLQRSNDDENFKELVCRFLSSNEAGTWLLIVDNADDPELVFGSENESGIDQFLPESENGLVLLTTRSRQIGVTFAQVDIIDIEGMQQEEASHLLEKSLIRKQLLHDTTLVKELLMQLAYLPLAITQAAAYLNQTMAPIQAYLQHLQGIGNNVARILGREFKDNTRYRGSRNAVATTWLVSFDQIEKSDPLAVSLLSFISCIEPKAIPRSILPMTDLEEQEWAIGTLCGYSFLVRRGDSDVFDMHSLVQLAMREWVMKQNRRHQVIEDAMHHLRDVLSSTSYAARDSWGYYLPHALRVLYENEKPETDDLYNLFSQVGDYLESQRRFKEAMKCYEEVCHYKQKHLSEQNASRLTSEQVLGSVYIENRQIKKAISILEHVVSVRKDISDETDPERLTSQHELARAYLDNSQIKDAIEILEHVVSRRKDTLEEKDDERLASEHALAMAYIDCGRNEDAIGIIEHVVAVTAETMDMTDHERLASEHELARAYLNSGRTKDAIAILQHVVAVEKETLNEKDHDRLVTEHVLARAYVDDGRIKDAIEILERVVSIRKETLNEKDPERIYSEQELARAYRADGRV